MFMQAVPHLMLPVLSSQWTCSGKLDRVFMLTVFVFSVDMFTQAVSHLYAYRFIFSVDMFTQAVSHLYAYCFVFLVDMFTQAVSHLYAYCFCFLSGHVHASCIASLCLLFLSSQWTCSCKLYHISMLTVSSSQWTCSHKLYHISVLTVSPCQWTCSCKLYDIFTPTVMSFRRMCSNKRCVPSRPRH